MPKQTFFNINEQKQKMILKIAVNEFTSKSFEEVSVNSIVKTAKISRGSFYTYFEDLDDLFSYLILNLKKNRLKSAMIFIDEANNNFFDFIKLLFAYDLKSFISDDKYSLLRNYIHYLRFNKKTALNMSIINPLYNNEDLNNDYINQILKLKVPGISNEEFFDLMEIVFLIMINSYFKLEYETVTEEELLELFKKRMDMLEFGVRHKQT